jgi:hypothetical protein
LKEGTIVRSIKSPSKTLDFFPVSVEKQIRVSTQTFSS